MLQKRTGYRDNLGIVFHSSPHTKTLFELSLIPSLIWSSGFNLAYPVFARIVFTNEFMNFFTLQCCQTCQNVERNSYIVLHVSEKIS